MAVESESFMLPILLIVDQEDPDQTEKDTYYLAVEVLQQAVCTKRKRTITERNKKCCTAKLTKERSCTGVSLDVPV